MTLTKREMVEIIAEANGFTLKKATETLEILIELIQTHSGVGPAK